MQLSWLSRQDSLAIVLALMAAMMLTGEIGYRVARRWRERADDARKQHFAIVKGSLLGLLGLLLAFTFGMSVERFEVRRQLVVDDANVLGALYLRSSLLPDTERGQFRQILRRYVDVFTDSRFTDRDPTAQELADVAARCGKLHAQMWEVVRGLAQRNPPAKGADDVLGLLTDEASTQTRRLYAFTSRVPDPVTWLLLGAAAAAMTVVGYSAGLGNHRGTPAMIMLALFVCATTYIVLDLDRPRKGIIQIDQAPLLRVKQIIDRGPEP